LLVSGSTLLTTAVFTEVRGSMEFSELQGN
jgi:hypothetical protein